MKKKKNENYNNNLKVPPLNGSTFWKNVPNFTWLPTRTIFRCQYMSSREPVTFIPWVPSRVVTVSPLTLWDEAFVAERLHRGKSLVTVGLPCLPVMLHQITGTNEGRKCFI